MHNAFSGMYIFSGLGECARSSGASCVFFRAGGRVCGAFSGVCIFFRGWKEYTKPSGLAGSRGALAGSRGALAGLSRALVGSRGLWDSWGSRRVKKVGPGKNLHGPPVCRVYFFGPGKNIRSAFSGMYIFSGLEKIYKVLRSRGLSRGSRGLSRGSCEALAGSRGLSQSSCRVFKVKPGKNIHGPPVRRVDFYKLYRGGKIRKMLLATL